MRTRHSLFATLAATVVLTAGCGGAASPGSAVRVGDDTVSLSQVNAMSQDYCDAQSDVFTANNFVAPMSLIRAEAVRGVVMRTIGEQIASAYDVKPGSDYSRAVSSLRAQTATLPEAQRDVVLEIEGSYAYLQDVSMQAAKLQLEQDGVKDPSREDIGAKASDLFTHWADSHPVELDPRFDLTFKDGQFVPADGGGSLSQPVGSAAEEAKIVSEFLNAEQLERQSLQGKLADYARSLPADQRCGA